MGRRGWCLLGVGAWVDLGSSTPTGQFEGEKWEVFVTPDYVRALLVDGLLNTLKMAFTAILGLAVVFGFVFGRRQAVGARLGPLAIVGGRRVLPGGARAAADGLHLVCAGHRRKEGSSYWGVVIALTLYNGSVLAEVLRAGVLAVPTRPGSRRRTPSGCARAR